MMRIMFSLTGDQADNITFQQWIEGDVWAGNETYGNARVTKASLNFADLQLIYDDEGNITITVIDPWMTGSNPGYLDGMEFRWNGNLTLAGYSTGNIVPAYGNFTTDHIGWHNPSLAEAPTGYRIILKGD